jgi:NAD-dependent deacetylase
MNTAFRIGKQDNLAVLTGAGISAESGLKTFRDNNGLWEQHRVEDVATPRAFAKDPAMVWRFYKQRYFQLDEVMPNPGHAALVALEQSLGSRFSLITQNVDGLHARAGNQRVYEMHGSLHSCFCNDCGAHFAMQDVDLQPAIPQCPTCGGDLRPDIVWFGEMPYFLEEIDGILQRATHFLVIGTSGSVYPAAQFVAIARMHGARTMGVNLAPPDNINLLDEFHQGLSGQILPGLVEQWLS